MRSGILMWMGIQGREGLCRDLVGMRADEMKCGLEGDCEK